MSLSFVKRSSISSTPSTINIFATLNLMTFSVSQNVKIRKIVGQLTDKGQNSWTDVVGSKDVLMNITDSVGTYSERGICYVLPQDGAGNGSELIYDYSWIGDLDIYGQSFTLSFWEALGYNSATQPGTGLVETKEFTCFFEVGT